MKNIVEARLNFKIGMAARPIEKAMTLSSLTVALAAAQGQVDMALFIAGDFNLRSDHMKYAMESVTSDDCFGAMHVNFVREEELLKYQCQKKSVSAP